MTVFYISSLKLLCPECLIFFFFKQKTAYEMRISDWSSDVCSSDLPVGGDVTIHTEMLVGEDFLRLLGFAKAEERDWFRLLTSVQGVGAKVALAILSALEIGDLQRALASGDSAMIARANGVGPKLAQRITHELKD